MRKNILLFMGVIALLGTTVVSAQNLENAFDEILETKYLPKNPGATALVAKEGNIIYRKGFGMANLELGVPMKPEHVFELGSITKQFTAVSILMLLEQGKLRLDDDITKYLPDYPAHDQKISIHHLLNHTSGIKSYTEMGNLKEFAKNDKSPKEIIDYFKNEPMDFNPGEEWHYNNSGYIVLGYIIEEISGKPYADFITENIFKPLGMENSYYGSKTKLVPNRASGYMPTENGYRNADYISMTLPYAAGSLMSCVDDMLLWHKAVHNNTLISAENRSKAFTNVSLNNGKATNYGYGWQINEINGVRSVEHGGGIFGYVTQGVYVPEEDVYVILLTNTNGNSPQLAAVKMAAHAMGKPFPDTKTTVTLTDGQMEKWIGNYLFEDDVLRTISLTDGTLYSQREGNEKLKLLPLSENKFLFENGISGYDFSMENGKKIAQFQARILKGKGVETDKKSDTEKETIPMDPKTLKEYIGSYELNPQFIINITVKDGQIFAEATGQPQAEIFPEAEDTFFLKVVAAQLIFGRDGSGNVDSVSLKQSGQEMKGAKKK
ncbi:MAG: serine hydrolase [Saonia sp.]